MAQRMPRMNGALGLTHRITITSLKKIVLTIIPGHTGIVADFFPPHLSSNKLLIFKNGKLEVLLYRNMGTTEEAIYRVLPCSLG